MARRGKIARLGKPIRDELNVRLQNGEVGAALLDWLNGLPEVQEVLKAQFEGRPVNDQNLSDWRNGGYAEWEVRQEAEMLRAIRSRAEHLDKAVAGAEISDCLATVVAAEMTGLARTLLAKETEPEKRWKRLSQVNKQLSRIRRDDHREVRVMIQRDRWEREVKVEEKPLNHPQLTREERQRRIKEIYGLA